MGRLELQNGRATDDGAGFTPSPEAETSAAAAAPPTGGEDVPDHGTPLLLLLEDRHSPFRVSGYEHMPLDGIGQA